MLTGKDSFWGNRAEIYVLLGERKKDETGAWVLNLGTRFSCQNTSKQYFLSTNVLFTSKNVWPNHFTIKKSNVQYKMKNILTCMENIAILLK